MIKSPLHDSNKDLIITVSLFGLILAVWLWVCAYTPADQSQGEVFKIIYVHVPAAFAAFFAAGVLFVYSVLALRLQEGSDKISTGGRASAEVGLIFTLATLFTGSVWGRPTWGVWWTWDARLTTTAILGLLYFGYILLYESFSHHRERRLACSIIGILIFLDVPIIYQSVNWWRTLHQPQTIIRSGGSTMDTEMLIPLILGSLLTLAFCLALIYSRQRNLLLKEKLESSQLKDLH